VSRNASRILFFLHSLAGGGAERVAAALLNAWASEGRDVTLLTNEGPASDAYPLDPRVRRETLGLASPSSSPAGAIWRNVQRVRALRGVLTRLQPDIAIAFMTTSNILLALARGAGRGIAIGAERVHPPAMPLGVSWEALRWWTYGRLDGVVAQTERSAAWIRSHTRARAVRIIPNPVAWPLTAQGAGRSPGSVGVAERKRLLGAGRLEPQKGFDQLIDAFAAVNAPDWELVILGEGALRPALEERVTRAGMEDRIFLPGAVSNIGDWYQHATLFGLSSSYEGFPNVLAEAMAHGLPVVSFNCDTGPADLIEDGVNGLLVPPGDAAGFRGALERLMRDAELRRQLGARATDVRERFALPAVLRQWQQFMGDVALRQ
jgi:glycosyltransferase involved in cell wall biosynthesis